VFWVFEVMYRRIKPETIRETVHKQIYGADSQGNEITKFLIQQSHSAKRSRIEGFQKLEQVLKPELAFNSVKNTQRLYSSAAYACLTSIVMNTQSKETVFSQFLFASQRDKGDEQLWSMIVDLDQ